MLPPERATSAAALLDLPLGERNDLTFAFHGDVMVTVSINGESYDAADPSRNLLSFIRFAAGLTGTKYGCGEGVCGACTVLVDGQPLRSCMTNVGAVAGGALTTIEGLAVGDELHPVQQAFIDEQAMQCGYCIPGFIMTSVALLNREQSPDRAQIREALSQNMCRCGTYQRIVRAVERASGAKSGA